MAGDERSRWLAALQGAVTPRSVIQRFAVVEEVDSTQDEARRIGLGAGSAVVALRQRRGRGRLGRAWQDTGCDGIALTAILEMDEPARLSIRCAVAAARAIESLVGRDVGIKWPNDLWLDGGKVGGVLIEVVDGVAHAGIGINVSQHEWPGHLAGRAVSLLQRGHAVDRLALVVAMMQTLTDVWAEGDPALADSFRGRDILSGKQATLEHDRKVYSGEILAIDPLRSVTVRTGDGDVALPAHSTRLISLADSM